MKKFLIAFSLFIAGCVGSLPAHASYFSQPVQTDNTSIDKTAAQLLEIKDSGVTTAKINALAVTTAKIAASAVDSTKMSGVVGDPVSKSFETVYQAATDGFLVGNTADTTTSHQVTCYTDSANPPTTVVMLAGGPWVSGFNHLSFLVSFPVKKNNYYKCVNSIGAGGTLNFIPLGS